MDIIEIDSSDSEDEFGTGSLSSEEFCVDDRVDQLDSNSQWRVENNDPQAVFPTRSSNYNDYRAAAPGFTLDAASSTTISGASLGNSATKTVMHGPRLGAYETIVDFERAKFKNNLSPSRMSKGSELSSLTNPESEAISARSGMGLNSSTLLNQGTPFSIQKDVTKPGRDHREDLYKDAPKRVLPPSMFSSKNKTLAKDFSSLKDEKKIGAYMSSSFAGENAFHDLTRIKAPQFADEKLSTLPRASLESRDDLHRNATTSRMLPSSFVLGKVIHTLPSPSTSDGERHLGIGGDRHLERDERHIYQEALQNLGQPRLEDDLPEGLLAVPLLKHQKIALAWMAQKEKSVHCSGGILADDQGLGKTISMIALIQKQMPQQSKFTSDDSNCAKPEALNLDEDEDVVVEVDKTKPLSVDNDQIRRRVAGSVMHTSNNSRPAAGTLVVCPATVLRQWARELDEKVPDNARLSVLVYHGGTRTKDPNELAKYHVVLTTYSIITNEVPKQSIADDDEGEQKNLDKYGLIPEFGSNKKRKQASSGQNNMKKKRKNLKGFIDFSSGPLARVRWFRVILDEAQTIKNHRTQVARACCGLRAKRRWCLSGTPMQNAIDDLYSYFRFLKYDPYSLYSSFCASIKYPISKNASNGYKKLQAVLKTVLLRRTKDSFIDGEPILKLPPKSICLKKVDFSQEERDFYLKLEADSRQQFKEFAATGTLRQNYASILMLLLRLRQACDHPLLVKGFHTDTIGKFSVDMARQLPRDMQVNLLNQLEGSLPICAVCSDPPEDAVVSMCGHVFCYQCVSECLTGDDNTCPAPRCKDVLGNDSVFSRSTLRSCISDNFDDEASTSTAFEEHHITHSGYISSKIKAALDILKPIACPSSRTVNNLMICGPDSNENSTNHVSTYLNSNSKVPDKAIVFSQWTSMLDLLELSLNDSLIQYRRLDGRMSLVSRDQAVKDFNTDPEVTVMLMSLKAGSLGLNMVAACHVILLDLWWNPTTEDQAVDRAHRIGQTRPVTVSRITIKDTVEDRILALQEEKRKMVASAFGEDQAGTHATKLTIDDLRYLFNCFND